MYLPHEDDENDEEMKEDCMLRHFKWYEFRELKAEFESAIEKGNNNKFPLTIMYFINFLHDI